MAETQLLKRKALASYFGVHPNTIHSWEKQGKIKPAAIINGRYLYDLEQTIEQLKKSGGKNDSSNPK